MTAVDIDGPDGLKARLHDPGNKDEQRYCCRSQQIQPDFFSLLTRVIVGVILNSLRKYREIFCRESEIKITREFSIGQKKGVLLYHSSQRNWLR